MTNPTNWTRRRFLLTGLGAAAATILTPSIAWGRRSPAGTLLNDVQSQLNPIRVRRIVRPRGADDLIEAIHSAARQGRPVSMAGTRHAMGGQQFGTDHVHLDMTSMNRVLEFNPKTGQIEIESGITWPALMNALTRLQPKKEPRWGIVQKQTGLDHLTIGGALASNIHGRGLHFRPIVQDVEAFTLIKPNGQLLRCSRSENAEVFRSAIGGYGLFGPMTGIRLRLARRQKVERRVEIATVDKVMNIFQEKISEGHLYGDFQYSIARDSDDYLRTGILTCYRPVSNDRPITAHADLTAREFRELAYLAHVNPGPAFAAYSRRLLDTSGQVFWSDEQQRSLYVADYHRAIDLRLGQAAPATEMLTEIDVPRAALASFLAEVREDFIHNHVELIYGVVRLVERDDETLLAWAREPWACVIFNLHTVHTPAGIEQSARDCRRLLDIAIRYGGTYYLTYHRWATPEQVLACHPRFIDFLREKRRFDPKEQFSSDWYQYYVSLFRSHL